MGLHLSVDDFGTGYSSFSYLKHFPLDTLKIDRSFVREITIDPDDAAITTAIIAMGHALGLKVVAEGVETSAQQTLLRRQGCDELQGYFFSRPVPADRFAAYLADAPASGKRARGAGAA
jgi:EAL domain-containing protein (putative c-di-GMP-specific phosphodiesterase class I)